MTGRQWRRSFMGLKVVTLGIAACSGSGVATPGGGGSAGDGADGGGAAASALTYYRDVKPIVDAKCTTCHVEAGIAPFKLTTFADVALHKDAIASATATRTMPPWPPGKGCTDYTGDRSLTDAQIATLGTWVQSGAAEGNAADFAPLPAEPAAMSRVDLTVTMPEAYTPKQRPDDYRCFVLDWNDPATKYITGFGAAPGHASMVHHILAFAIDPSQVAAFEKFDADDPGPGYTCFGGPFAGGAQTVPVRQIGGWAPGVTGKDYPAGTGIRIDPGAKIVMQVHYNTLSTDPTPDQTGITLSLASSVTKEAQVVPWTNPNWVKSHTMSIPAGNPDVAYSFGYDALAGMSLITKGAIASGAPVTVYSATLHMHLLGTNAKIEVQHATGDNECLLTIPRWNFHWQGAYGFAQPKQIQPGDKVNIECHWDNSEGNQPVVNGVQLEPPKEVNWGEGSTDEMCLGYLYVTQ